MNGAVSDDVLTATEIVNAVLIVPAESTKLVYNGPVGDI